MRTVFVVALGAAWCLQSAASWGVEEVATAALDLPARIAATRAATQKLVADKKIDEAALAWKTLVEDVPDKIEARLARLEFLAAQAQSFGIDEHRSELTAVLALLPDDPARRGELSLAWLKLLYSRGFPDRYQLKREYDVYRDDLARHVMGREQLAWIAFDCEQYADAHERLAAVLAEAEGKLAQGRKANETALASAKGREFALLKKKVDEFEKDAAGATTEVTRLRRQVLWLSHLNSKPDNAVATVQHSCALALAGDDLDADIELLAADSYDPRSVLVRCWSANRRIAYGNYADAQTIIDEALALDPESAEAYICRGALRQAQCRFDDALADFDRANQRGRRPEGYQRKAQILFYRGQLDEAFEALATALLIEPPQYSLLLPVRLAEPLDSAKASVVAAPPPNPKIASTDASAAAVAAAQLKLTRGDLEGAERDLVALGDYAAQWRTLYRTVAPQSKAEGSDTSPKSRAQEQDAQRKSIIALTDGAAGVTLGIVRATWNEDQELFQLREHPLAVPPDRHEPRIELAYWNFVIVNSKRSEAEAFAALIPRDEGNLFATGDQRKFAEYRAVAGPLRSVALYRRSRAAVPQLSGTQPVLNATERFERARSAALTPATIGDALALARSLAAEFKAGTSIDTADSVSWQTFRRMYDAQLMALAGQVEQLPSHAYAEPLLPAVDANQTRITTLRLLQRELNAAAARLGDAPEKQALLAAATKFTEPIKRIMNLAEYQAQPRGLDQKIRSAKTVDEARPPLDALRKLGEEEHPEACYLLGMLYYVGTPQVPSSSEQTMAWLTKGAELGHVRSQATLGVAYLTGGHTRRDLNAAERWLVVAAAAGDTEAKQGLEEVKRSREFERTAAEQFAKLDPKNLDASIQADPKNPILYERRCVTRLRAKQDALALEDADKVIELRPDDDDGYALRFVALTFLARDAEAQKAKETMQKMFPTKVGQLDKALAELRKARGQ